MGDERQVASGATIGALLGLSVAEAAAGTRALGEERLLDLLADWPGWAHGGQVAPAG